MKSTVEVQTVYLGYSGVAVRVGGAGLLFDPSNMINPKTIEFLAPCKPILVLYTHDHYDHYNAEALKRLAERLDFKVVVEPNMIGKVRGMVAAEKLLPAEHKKALEVEGVKIVGVRGRHVGPITLYYVEAFGVKIFHGGDSGHMDLSGLGPVDLAILPCGSPSPTASPRDAYKMALDLKPKHVMAVHGSSSEMDEFKRLLMEGLPEAGFTAAKPSEKYVFKW